MTIPRVDTDYEKLIQNKHIKDNNLSINSDI